MNYEADFRAVTTFSLDIRHAGSTPEIRPKTRQRRIEYNNTLRLIVRSELGIILL